MCRLRRQLHQLREKVFVERKMPFHNFGASLNYSVYLMCVSFPFRPIASQLFDLMVFLIYRYIYFVFRFCFCYLDFHQT